MLKQLQTRLQHANQDLAEAKTLKEKQRARLEIKKVTAEIQAFES